MKDKSEVIPKITVIALVIIAFFLAYWLLSELSANTNAGANFVIVIGFLVTVIICVSLGSWVALTGETTHKITLLVSLLLGSGLIFLLSLFFAMEAGGQSPTWKEYYPWAVYSFFVTAACLFVLASILAVEAIAVLIHIVRAGRK